MKRVSPFGTVVWAALLSAPLTCDGALQLACTAAAERAEYKLGEPVYLRVTLENVGDRDVLLKARLDDPEMWRVRVGDDATRALARERTWRQPRPSGFDIGLRRWLKPRDTLEVRLRLGEWITLCKPGPCEFALAFSPIEKELSCSCVVKFSVTPSTRRELYEMISKVSAGLDKGTRLSEERVRELAAVGDDLAIRPLLASLEHDCSDDAPFALTVVRGLRDIETPAAVEALVGLLRSADAFVRRLAAEALGSLPRHRDLWEAALQDALQREGKQEVRKVIAEALRAPRLPGQAPTAARHEPPPVPLPAPRDAASRYAWLRAETQRIAGMFDGLNVTGANEACRRVLDPLAGWEEAPDEKGTELVEFVALYAEILKWRAENEAIPVIERNTCLVEARGVYDDITTPDGLTRVIVALENPRSPADFGPPRGGHRYIARLEKMMRAAGREGQASRIAGDISDPQLVRDALALALQGRRDEALDLLAANIKAAPHREFVSDLLRECRRPTPIERVLTRYPLATEPFLTELDAFQSRFKGFPSVAQCGLARLWCAIAAADAGAVRRTAESVAKLVCQAVEPERATDAIIGTARRLIRAGMYSEARTLCRAAESLLVDQACLERLRYCRARGFLEEERHDLDMRGENALREQAADIFSSLLEQKLCSSDRIEIYDEAISLFDQLIRLKDLLRAFDLALSDESHPKRELLLLRKGDCQRELGMEQEARATYTELAEGNYSAAYVRAAESRLAGVRGKASDPAVRP